MARVAVAVPARLGRRAGEDRQVQPRRPRAARARAGARPALLPARPLPLHQGANFKEALELFTAVPEQERVLRQGEVPRGHDLRPPVPGEARGSEAFKAILRKAKESPDKRRSEYEELANLSLARTFYALGQFPQSIKYYDKIENDSPEWLAVAVRGQLGPLPDRRRLEGARQHPHAQRPLFRERVLPGVDHPQGRDLLPALQLRPRHGSGQRVQRDSIPGLKKDIDAIIAKYPDNAEFYDYVLKIRDGDAGLPDACSAPPRAPSPTRRWVKSLEYVAELDRELKQVEQRDPAWKRTAIAGTILQDLTLQKSLATNDAGNLARDRLKRLCDEISELVSEAIKVEYETLQRAEGRASRPSIKEEQVPQPGTPSKKLGDVIVDDEHERWPFQGEYWKDELGYYRFKVVNKCDK